MSVGPRRFVGRAGACLVACWATIAATMPGGPADADEPARIVRGALDLACAARGRDDLLRLGNRLLGGRPSGRPSVTTDLGPPLELSAR